MDLAQKIGSLELIADKLQNLADECYDLGFTALGNTLIEQGNAVYVQIAVLEEDA